MPRVEVYWRAVTYKTVILYTVLGLGLLFGGIYLAKPSFYEDAYNWFDKRVKNPEIVDASIEQRRAKFVNLDGKVEIKKKDSVQWVDADFRVTLDKGDQIKTGSDGAARITFADGTHWTAGSHCLQQRHRHHHRYRRLFDANLHARGIESGSACRRYQSTAGIEQPRRGEGRPGDEVQRVRGFYR